jgi:hypothetical protein
VPGGFKSESGEIKSRQVVAIMRLAFPGSTEIRGEAVSRLPVGLVNELRLCATGKLSRNELVDLSARIISNNAAIETLAS